MDDHKAKVTQRAYDIWIAEGCPVGMEYQHWIQAWHELHGTLSNCAIDGSPETLSTERSSGPDTSQQDMGQSVSPQ